MRFLLDTNVISALRRGSRRYNRNVATWYGKLDERDIFTSVIVMGEIRRGIEQIRKRNDTEQAEVLERWFKQTTRQFSDRILPVDAAVADTWGKITAIRPVPVDDSLLAATAIEHHMILATRNVAHVSGLGVQIINPFEEA